MQGKVKKCDYLVIGGGRVAKHFSHYLSLLKIPHHKWSRSRNKNNYLKLKSEIARADKIILLLPDGAIESFIIENPPLRKKILIHFSGCLQSQFAYGMHPLATFGNSLYSLGTYKKICFITDAGAPSFGDLFPELKNKSFAIPSELKPFYHALCVLCGNGTTLLWQKFFQELELKLHLPKSVAKPYLKQIALNLAKEPQLSLTGPFVRGDLQTIASNLRALSNTPFKKTYQALLDLYEGKK